MSPGSKAAGQAETIPLSNQVQIPLVGLGTWDLRGDVCVRTVAAAIQMGYRLIDTAQMYGNEEAVGRGIAQGGTPRDQLFVTTKLYRVSNSYEKARLAIDQSLARLGTDYVDLLLLHEPYPQGPEMYRALEQALEVGKARAIGVSNYDPHWYETFLGQCQVVPAVNQLEVHVLFQKWQFQAQMAAHGTALQAWAPLAQGLAGVASHPVLAAIGQGHGKTAAQVALRFLVQRGISVIPKSQRPERLAENLALFDFALSPQEMERIRALDRDDTLFPWTKAF